jgi:hypothetical protein
VNVPIDQTVSGWHRTTRTRFLSVTQARVQPIQDDLKMEGAEGVYKFVLINRRRLTALIETRVSGDAHNGGDHPPQEHPAPEHAAGDAAETTPPA